MLYFTIIVSLLFSSNTQSLTFQQSIQTPTKSRILQSQPTCFKPLPALTNTNSFSSTTQSSGLRTPAPIVGSVQNSHSAFEYEITTKYEQFISFYKPSSSQQWGSSQYSYRSLIYQSNLQKINENNMKQGSGYLMGVNAFCDLTQKQFNALYSKLIIPDEIKKVTYGLRQSIKNGIKDTFGDDYSSLWNTNLPSGTSPAVTLAQKNRDKNLRAHESSSSSFQQTLSPSTFIPKNIASASTSIFTSIGSKATSPIIGSTSSFLNAFATLTIPSSSTNTPASYTIPERITIDWSCKASAIINQGICGSCFAIAPLQTIYMALRIYNRTILPLSIQEVLSCTDSSNGAFGCGGGYFLSSYEYVRVNGTGRALLYPYNTRATNEGVVTACNRTLINSQSYTGTKFRIRESGFIPFNDCAELIQRLKIQPIAVSIATTNLQYYINGTYNVVGQMPNHGVVLVGYDPQKGYKIKNSWGSTWGDAGYGYVSENTGVCDYSMYPITGFEGTGNWECC